MRSEWRRQYDARLAKAARAAAYHEARLNSARTPTDQLNAAYRYALAFLARRKDWPAETAGRHLVRAVEELVLLAEDQRKRWERMKLHDRVQLARVGLGSPEGGLAGPRDRRLPVRAAEVGGVLQRARG